jgi:glutathione S-transferase
MKLYYSKGACSLAVRITLHEIGIPCEFESVNLQTKKTETGTDFLNINPKGYVPTLVLDNQEVLTENVIIQLYLAEEYKAKELLPTNNTFEHYRALEWLAYVNTELHKACSPLFNSKLPAAIKEEFFVPALKNKLSFVDQHLSKNKYLLNERYTPADGYLLVILLWMPHFNIELSEWRNLSRYLTLLKMRPGIQQSLKEEGLS